MACQTEHKHCKVTDKSSLHWTDSWYSEVCFCSCVIRVKLYCQPFQLTVTALSSTAQIICTNTKHDTNSVLNNSVTFTAFDTSDITKTFYDILCTIHTHLQVDPLKWVCIWSKIIDLHTSRGLHVQPPNLLTSDWNLSFETRTFCQTQNPSLGNPQNLRVSGTCDCVFAPRALHLMEHIIPHLIRTNMFLTSYP